MDATEKRQGKLFRPITNGLIQILAGHFLVYPEELPARVSISDLLKESRQHFIGILWILKQGKERPMILGFAIEQRILITLLGTCLGLIQVAKAVGVFWIISNIIWYFESGNPSNYLHQEGFILYENTLLAIIAVIIGLSLLCLCLMFLFWPWGKPAEGDFTDEIPPEVPPPS